MNLFKTFTLLWWQASVLKVGLLSVGIIIGALWSSFFRRYVVTLGVVAILTLSYVTFVWARQ
jgi:hypothetical protein